MTIAITACYGRNKLEPYDMPKWPPKGVDEAFAFTDDVRWFELGWQRPPFERNNGDLSPRMRGKAPKAAPHLFGFDDDIVWLDASMVRTGESLKSAFELVPVGGVGCFAHRWRDCIYDEAEASVATGFNRYAREPIREQVAHYRRQGHPERHGLFELGCILWRGAQKLVGEAWLAEMLSWSSQDQLSFPVVCRRYGVTPTRLPGNALSNPWFNYTPHQGTDQ